MDNTLAAHIAEVRRCSQAGWAANPLTRRRSTPAFPELTMGHRVSDLLSHGYGNHLDLPIRTPGPQSVVSTRALHLGTILLQPHRPRATPSTSQTAPSLPSQPSETHQALHLADSPLPLPRGGAMARMATLQACPPGSRASAPRPQPRSDLSSQADSSHFGSGGSSLA